MEYLKLTRIDPQSGATLIVYIDASALNEEHLKKVIDGFARSQILESPGVYYITKLTVSKLALNKTKKNLFSENVALEVINMAVLTDAREKNENGETIPLDSHFNLNEGVVPTVRVDKFTCVDLFDELEKEKPAPSVVQEQTKVQEEKVDVSAEIQEEEPETLESLLRKIEAEPEENAEKLAERKATAEVFLRDQELRLKQLQQSGNKQDIQERLQKEAQDFLLPDDLQYRGVNSLANVFLANTVVMLAPRAVPAYPLGSGMEDPGKSNSKKLEWKMDIERVLRSTVEKIDETVQRLDVAAKKFKEKEQKAVLREPVVVKEFNELVKEVIEEYSSTLKRTLPEQEKARLASQVRDAILGKDPHSYLYGEDPTFKQCQLGENNSNFDSAFIKTFNRDYPLKVQQKMQERIQQKVSRYDEEHSLPMKKSAVLKELAASEPRLRRSNTFKEMEAYGQALREYDEEVARLNAATQEEDAEIRVYLNTLVKLERAILEFSQESQEAGEEVSQRLLASPDGWTQLSEANIYDALRASPSTLQQREQLEAGFQAAFQAFYQQSQYARGSDWGKLLSKDPGLQKLKEHMYAYRVQLDHIRKMQEEQVKISAWVQEIESRREIMVDKIRQVKESKGSMAVDVLVGQQQQLQKSIQERMEDLLMAPKEILKTRDIAKAEALYKKAQGYEIDIEALLLRLNGYSQAAVCYGQLQAICQKAGIHPPQFDEHWKEHPQEQLAAFQKLLNNYQKIAECYRGREEKAPSFAEVSQCTAEAVASALRKYAKIAEANQPTGPNLSLPTFTEITQMDEETVQEKIMQHQRDLQAYQEFSSLCQQTQSLQLPWHEFLDCEEKMARPVLFKQGRILQELQAVLNDVDSWGKQVVQYKLRGDMVEGEQNGKNIKRYVPTGVAKMHAVLKDPTLSVQQKLEQIHQIAEKRLEIERPRLPSFLSGSEAKEKTAYRRPFGRGEATQQFYELIKGKDLQQFAGLAIADGEFRRFSKDVLTRKEKPQKDKGSEKISLFTNSGRNYGSLNDVPPPAVKKKPSS